MNCCDPIDSHFSTKHAARDLVRYKKDGPDFTTRQIIAGVRQTGLRNASLLDVGAGIGAIHHELLQDICSSVTHVDMSSAYISIAKQEAAARGHSDRVQFVQGDLAQLPGDGYNDPDFSEPHSYDIVTLDRVVCCYPDHAALLKAAVAKCKSVLAVSYPRDRWFVRVGFWLDNLKRRIKRDPFRAYVHPTESVQKIVLEQGLQPQEMESSPFWQIQIYSRQQVINELK